MIKIVVDDKGVRGLLSELQRKSRDLSPAMRNIAGIMHNAVMENFEAEGRPSWKRSKRAAKEGGKTLQDTTQLKKSVSRAYGSRSARVGTNKVYAAIHQFGGKAGRGRKVTIPARPFLQLTDEDLEEIKEALMNYLARE